MTNIAASTFPQAAEIVSIIIVAISIMAFSVSVITQVLKSVGALNKLPTDALVLFLSISMSIIVFMAFMEIYNYKIRWYMPIAAVMMGFIVAFVAMFGWSKLYELWKRFGKGTAKGQK